MNQESILYQSLSGKILKYIYDQEEECAFGLCGFDRAKIASKILIEFQDELANIVDSLLKAKILTDNLLDYPPWNYYGNKEIDLELLSKRLVMPIIHFFIDANKDGAVLKELPVKMIENVFLIWKTNEVNYTLEGYIHGVEFKSDSFEIGNFEIYKSVRDIWLISYKKPLNHSKNYYEQFERYIDELRTIVSFFRLYNDAMGIGVSQIGYVSENKLIAPLSAWHVRDDSYTDLLSPFNSGGKLYELVYSVDMYQFIQNYANQKALVCFNQAYRSLDSEDRVRHIYRCFDSLITKDGKKKNALYKANEHYKENEQELMVRWFIGYKIRNCIEHDALSFFDACHKISCCMYSYLESTYGRLKDQPIPEKELSKLNKETINGLIYDNPSFIYLIDHELFKMLKTKLIHNIKSQSHDA